MQTLDSFHWENLAPAHLDLPFPPFLRHTANTCGMDPDISQSCTCKIGQHDLRETSSHVSIYCPDYISQRDMFSHKFFWYFAFTFPMLNNSYHLLSNCLILLLLCLNSTYDVTTHSTEGSLDCHLLINSFPSHKCSWLPSRRNKWQIFVPIKSKPSINIKKSYLKKSNTHSWFFKSATGLKQIPPQIDRENQRETCHS